MKTLYTLFFGLYSFCAAAQYCGPLHVHPGATGAGTGESWQDAFVHLQDALDAAQPGAQIWVAAGVYLPQKDTTGNATPANDRSKTFFINKDIQLYGGFAGAEQELSQRDPAANPAILSGDLGTTGVATDNAYHVLWLALVSPLCIIDGFTITRGNANASDVNGTGGGILLRHQPLQYAAPVIQNCIIEHNHATTGGGFYTATDSWAGPSVSIEHCKFRNNTASSGGGIYFQQSMVAEVGLQLTNVEFSDQSIGQYGGGLYANGHFTACDCRFENNSSNRGAGANLEGGTAILENCAFIGNTSLRNGGGLRMERTTATVVNCLFLGNEANILNESSTTSNAGGGMFYRGSNTSFAKLANCVFSGNKGQNGAGFAQTTTVLNTSSAELDNCTFAGNNGASAVARLQGNLTIENSIIFGNEGTALTGGTARSCIIEGGYAGTDNVSVDPLFVALPSFLLAPTAAGNLKLQSGSPAIDQGDNALTPTGFITDADGNHRMINCTIDRGAFEFGTSGASDRICYADADGDGLGNAAMPRLACNTCPGGFVSNNGDCDDSNSAITHTLPPPAAIQLTTEFCWGEPSITLRSIQSATPGRLVWVLVQAPPGSRFEGQEPLEFHPGAVNAEFSTGTDNLLMCSTPSHQNTSVNGVWMFETYYETAAGCRSAVQQGFSITVRQTSTTQLSATACNSYTFNGQTYTQSGIYTQMLTNAEGCDSLLVIELAIGQADTTQLSATACNSYTFNGQTYTQSGIYTQMLTNAEGCDSLLVIELAIGQADTTQLSTTACNSYTFNGQTYTQSGIYTQMLTNAEGCDSLFTLHLEIVSPPALQFDVQHPSCADSGNGQATVAAAQGAPPFNYLWSNGQTTPVAIGLTTGLYTVTLTDANGCISIDTVTLTPQYQLLSSFTVMGTPVCHGDSTAAVTVSPMGGAAPFEYQWLHGPQTASLSGLPAGIYHVTITDANGCTATGATIFTDPPLLDISIVQNNHILTSQELDVEYQWINCDTGLPIQDAVNQSFEAIESGRYAVILSRGVCRDTSLCIEIMLVSAAEQRSALPKAEAYPNPNNGRFVLRMPVSGQIALYDATGRLLRTEVHGAGEHTLFIDGPAGLYWLAVMYNQGVQTLRIIRQ
jgi:predicted outer membrane repeat protein